MKLDIDFSGLPEFEKQLSRIAPDKWGKVLSVASNETAFYVRNKTRKEMPSFLDRPKPYTLNSIFVKKATASSVDASVEWRRPASGNSGGRYLLPTVEGGQRGHKGFEARLIRMGLMQSNNYAVPTKDAPQDVYGNIPSAFLRRILSSLTTKTKRKGYAFFVVTYSTGRLQPGIYERRTTGFGSGVRRVFTFVTETKYKTTFPFYELGRKAALEKFVSKLSEAIDNALLDRRTGSNDN